jgi:Na+/alanine symporter
VVNNPIFYAALMMLWLVAFPGFLIIYCVSGIGNVMSVVVPAAACLFILDSVGAIITSQWSQ